MNFDFGCARRLYENRVHPRVLLSPDDLDGLKRQIRTRTGRNVMEAIRAWVRPAVRQILDAKDDAEALKPLDGAYFGTPVCFGLDDVAMVARLDQDADALEAVRRFLLAMVRAENAGQTAYAPGSLRHQGMAYDLLYDLLPHGDQEVLTRWMVDWGVRKTLGELGRFLKAPGRNTPVCFMMSALFNLLCVEGDPGVPDLENERERLILLFQAALHSAIGPDGYAVEDVGYGTALVPYLAYGVEALRRAGLYDAYTACPRFARFGRSVLHYVQPWGRHLTSTGDQYDGIMDRQFILSRLAEMNGDPSLLWLIGTLRQGEVATGRFSEVALDRAGRFHVPASWVSLAVLDSLKRPGHPAKSGVPTSYVDRLRGIASFRSGWGEDDTSVVFDGSQRSPSAMGHEHASGGNFCLSALGEYFAIDCGRYSMEQNCHNVVLVDGQSGRSTDGHWKFTSHHGLLTGYRPGPFVDFASADSSMQHNCYWARRSLGLVKGRGAPAYVWLLDDINKANDWAEFWWQLHSSPENVIKIRGNRASIRGWRHGNWLDVHFVLPNPRDYPRPHELALAQDEAVPSSYRYIANPRERAALFRRPSDMLHAAVFVRPRLLAKVAGYNGRFMSLLLPRQKGTRPAKVRRLPSLMNSLAVRITFEDVEDTLIWAYEHHLLEAGGIKARGQWCVVRRCLATGKVVESDVEDGTLLECPTC